MRTATAMCGMKKLMFFPADMQQKKLKNIPISLGGRRSQEKFDRKISRRLQNFTRNLYRI